MLVRAGKKREDDWIKYGPPELLPDNGDAWAVFQCVRNQVCRNEWWDEKKQQRFAITEIRIEAIEAAMKIFGIDDLAPCFDKVKFIEAKINEYKKKYGTD